MMEKSKRDFDYLFVTSKAQSRLICCAEHASCRPLTDVTKNFHRCLSSKSRFFLFVYPWRYLCCNRPVKTSFAEYLWRGSWWWSEIISYESRLRLRTISTTKVHPCPTRPESLSPLTHSISAIHWQQQQLLSHSVRQNPQVLESSKGIELGKRICLGITQSIIPLL
jgi:hypothetical protein